MSECFRCPVCSCAPIAQLLAHETAGAACTRHSLRPLLQQRDNEFEKLGRKQAARTATHVSTSLRAKRPVRRSSKSEGGSNPPIRLPCYGLLRRKRSSQ